MASKFKRGQSLRVLGKDVIVARIERSRHGNTSKITLADATTGEEWPRPVRTAWLTKEVARMEAAAVQSGCNPRQTPSDIGDVISKAKGDA